MGKVLKLLRPKVKRKAPPVAKPVAKSRAKSKPATAPKAAKPRSANFSRRMLRLRSASYAIGAVAIVLTALSLSHLAAGVRMLTGSSEWHAWAMAVGIDLCFIALELGQLCVTTDVLRRQVNRFAPLAVVGTLVVSALMNAYAFAIQTASWEYMIAACALGLAIPALIYVCARVAVAMWIETHRA